MTTRLASITLGGKQILLVFLVPGTILTGTIAFWNPAIKSLMLHLLKTPDAASGIAVLVISFGLGSLVDTVRAYGVNKLLDLRSKVALPPDYFRKINKDNLDVLKFLFERSHEYYRLNANTALASTLLTISYLITEPCGGIVWLLIVLTILFWLAARKSRIETVMICKEFAEGAT